MKIRQPYIGGIFSSRDDDAFRGAGNQHCFPPLVNRLKRVIYETGSDALGEILGQRPDIDIELWIPGNFCEDTIKRVSLKSGKNLHTRRYSDVSQITAGPRPQVALLVHFNRFDASLSAAAGQLRRQQDIHVIEDFVQAPFDISKAVGHAAVSSLRKICGVEAAVAYLADEPASAATTSPYLLLKREAMDLRAMFIHSGDKTAEARHLEKSKNASDASHHPRIYLADAKSMDDFNTMDFAAIRAKRKRNRMIL
jgi:hypothetical protein